MRGMPVDSGSGLIIEAPRRVVGEIERAGQSLPNKQVAAYLKIRGSCAQRLGTLRSMSASVVQCCGEARSAAVIRSGSSNAKNVALQLTSCDARSGSTRLKLEVAQLY
jgi:hypothetical protein